MLFVSWPSPPEQEREISAESESKVTIFHFIHGIIFCVPNLLGFEAQKFVLGMKNLSSSIFFLFCQLYRFSFFTDNIFLEKRKEKILIRQMKKGKISE